MKNTSCTYCNVILSQNILLLPTFFFKINHFGLFLFYTHRLAASLQSIAGRGTRLTGRDTVTLKPYHEHSSAVLIGYKCVRKIINHISKCKKNINIKI